MTSAQRLFLVVALLVSAFCLVAVNTELVVSDADGLRLLDLSRGTTCPAADAKNFTIEEAYACEGRFYGWYLKHRHPYGLIVAVIIPLVLIGLAGYVFFGSPRYAPRPTEKRLSRGYSGDT